MVTKTHIDTRYAAEREFWVEQKWGSPTSRITPNFHWSDDISDHSICKRPFQLEMTRTSIAAFASAIAYSALTNVVENIYLSLNDLDRLVYNYAEKVSTLPCVKKIGLAESEGISTIWTIIDSQPFEDSVRLPIYDAQFHVLRAVPRGISLDFRIINVQEIEPNLDPRDSFPSNMKIIWRDGDVAKAVPHR
jgi:hypothetical protein